MIEQSAGQGPIVRQEPAVIEQPIRPSRNKDAWKNKWVYLGGSFGIGSSAWNKTYRFDTPDFPYYYNHKEEETGVLYSPCIIVDFALLPFFAIELGAGLGMGYADRDFVPLIPILAKVGYRFAQIELSFDAGYTVGAGFTLGGTAGVNIGPGILFAKFLVVPKASPFEGDDEYTLLSGMAGFLGYKIGLGNK